MNDAQRTAEQQRLLDLLAELQQVEHELAHYVPSEISQTRRVLLAEQIALRRRLARLS